MTELLTGNAGEAATMELLLAAHPSLLSRGEIRREIGSATDVDDFLVRFASLGLVHFLPGDDRTGENDFFWATRAAIAAEEVRTSQD
jgi:trehalose-6-phosphatase